ncbi:MAG: polysaccharide deacetylase family protein [Oligoflexales bacterium]|nr:polysaccharide deacetylase family protein [Oligoflexales bacterium]
MKVFVLALSLVVFSLSAGAEQSDRLQYVLVSFDATGSATSPEESGFVRMARALERVNARFTMFINTGFLTLKPGWTPERGTSWYGHPELYEKFIGVMPLNRPAIKYARNPDEIEGRLGNLRILADMGMEIGSHTVRHDHGSRWTVAQWDKEFADHERILGILDLPKPLGLRAPFLECNAALYEVEKRRGMTYDASQTGFGRNWPKKIHTPAGDIWEIPVPSYRLVRSSGASQNALFMDLNLKDNFHLTPEEYYNSAMAEFNARYSTTRAPLVLAGHGGFMSAIQRVLMEVCVRPDVRCTTYSEFVEYLDSLQ